MQKNQMLLLVRKLLKLRVREQVLYQLEQVLRLRELEQVLSLLMRTQMTQLESFLANTSV
jgi:hypothetical protein